VQENSAGEESRLVVQQACGVLGCDASGVIPALHHMQTRLARFNSLLPKYQKVLSHLYEVLRISSLDEIVPAMERLMSQSCS
jgi:hypothetical protein